MRIFLYLVSLIVPLESRQRWREEWLAEVQHGGWRMITGALPDAWVMRGVPAKAGGIPAKTRSNRENNRREPTLFQPHHPDQKY